MSATGNQTELGSHPVDAAILAEHGKQLDGDGNVVLTGKQDPAWTTPMGELKTAVAQSTEAENAGSKLAEAMDYLETTEGFFNENPDLDNHAQYVKAQQRAEQASKNALIHDAKQDLFDLKENADVTLEVKTKYNENFRGTPLELVKEMAKAKVLTRDWANERVQQAEQQLQQQQTQQPPFDLNSLTQDDFTKLMARTFGYGDNVAGLMERIGKLLDASNKVEKQELEAGFRRLNPDFPDTDLAMDALQVVMEQSRLPWTVAGLSAAHGLAIRAGLYQPLSTADQRVARGEVVREPRPIVPPVVPSSSPDRAPAQDLYSMPLEELRKQILMGQGGR